MFQKFKKKLPKRLALIYVDIIISMLIWNINAKWGNDFDKCFSLSATTFLIIYTPFEIYWTFRDMWFDRWTRLRSQYLDILETNIEMDDGKVLNAHIVRSKDPKFIAPRNAIVVVCHGFSDTKETLQYYYLPLALQGYTILAYDARGSGQSKYAGRRGQFVERISDYEKIVNWIRYSNEFSGMRIYTVGFSIGAIAALCGGFPNKHVDKIIAISSFSNFRKNSAKYNPIVLLRYLLKGVNIHPNTEKNKRLSPSLIFKSLKKELSEEEWNKFKKKVLLVHAENDKVIKFKNFQENRLILDAPDDRVVIFKKGGHSFKKSELSLIGASLRFFDE